MRLAIEVVGKMRKKNISIIHIKKNKVSFIISISFNYTDLYQRYKRRFFYPCLLISWNGLNVNVGMTYLPDILELKSPDHPDIPGLLEF